MASAQVFEVSDFEFCCFISLVSFDTFTAAQIALFRSSNSMLLNWFIQLGWLRLLFVPCLSQVWFSPANWGFWSYSLANLFSAPWVSAASACFAYPTKYWDQGRTFIGAAVKRNYPAEPSHSISCHLGLAIQHSHSFDSILNLAFVVLLRENIKAFVTSLHSAHQGTPLASETLIYNMLDNFIVLLFHLQHHHQWIPRCIPGCFGSFSCNITFKLIFDFKKYWLYFI